MRTLFTILLCAICTYTGAVQAQSNTDNTQQESPWIDRPWDLRYVLHIKDQESWESSQRVAGRINAEPGKKYFSWSALFHPVFEVPVLQLKYTLDKSFSVVPIEFDQGGFVTTANTSPTPLRGKLSKTLSMVLIDGEDRNRPYSILGAWFTGLGDVSTHWAPALCDSNEAPNAVMVRFDTYLYGKLFKATSHSKTFGCREWAYQLYDDNRPYIDVTSYVPKDDDFEHGAYIRDVKGWARFGDKKPIIGKHETTWYCLYDCPNGEPPGQIANIKAWARANGWSAPKRPTKSPTFVDPPAKQGTYPQ